MELHRLTEHCYWSDPVAYGDRPILGLIAGVEATLAVDTGNGPGHGLWLLREAQRLGLPPVRWAALTHWHWDHVMGGRAMQEAGVSLLCTKGTEEQLRVLCQYKWTDEAIARRVADGLEIPFCQKGIREEYPDEPRPLDPPLPDLTIEGPVTIDLEGVTVRLLPQPSDHSPDGLLVHCPEDRVVFSGDSLSPNMYVAPWHYTRELFMPFLDALYGLGADWYFHSHMEGPLTRERFQQLFRDHRRFSWAAGEDVTMEAPLARLAEKLGREPSEEEEEDLSRHVYGNLMRGRLGFAGRSRP